MDIVRGMNAFDSSARNWASDAQAQEHSEATDGTVSNMRSSGRREM